MPHAKEGDKKKLVLIGKSGAGKTSMRSMIFANYSADDTKKLLPTLDAETTHVRILDKYILNVWDLGGQLAFTEHWNKNACSSIYSDVHILIFVLDCSSEQWMADLVDFVESIKHLKTFSGSAKIFFMIHKVDKIDYWKDENKVYEHKLAKWEKLKKFKNEIENKINATLVLDEDYKKKVLSNIKYRMTTIFDDSLYSAWGEVISNIVPNITEYEKKIKSFCSEIKADEIVLFEKRTFLALASCRAEYVPSNRQREVSEIMTNKLKSIHYQGSEISKPSARHKRGQNFTFKTSKYQLFFRQFTPNTCILVVFYMTDHRRNNKFGRYLCQNTDISEINEFGLDDQLPLNLAELELAQADLSLNISITSKDEEKGSEIETETQLINSKTTTTTTTTNTTSNTTNINNTTTANTTNSKPSISSQFASKNLNSKTLAPTCGSNQDKDFQFRLAASKTESQPVEGYVPSFEHSALIETCIKEFCDEMKILDSGNTTKMPKYWPR